MSALQRIARWLFPSPLERLLDEASRRGRVSLSEIDIGNGAVGWYVSIRPPNVPSGPHSHRYAWTGQHAEMVVALDDALQEAREFPTMIDMTEERCAPKIGGKEFDADS